jgi:hypothetical protein
MAKDDKKDGPKVTKHTPAKPVKRVMYINGPVNMPADMITTEDAFKKMWKGNLRGYNLDKAWQEAKEFKSKLK